MKDDFVFVDEFVSGIRWDAKYATWDNFTGKPVDGYLANRIVGTKALCAALERAREKAESLGFGLVLWDGYRPQRAVDCFLRWSKQPEDGRTKLRHYPNIDRAEMFEKGYVAAKSGHSRGSTVDLTLYHLTTGELAPMGGGHDLMDSISHHGAKGITQVEARNRQYLCSIMKACGFSSYDCEWWHYTLKHEPYPDTYFDFPIVEPAKEIGKVPKGYAGPKRRARPASGAASTWRTGGGPRQGAPQRGSAGGPTPSRSALGRQAS